METITWLNKSGSELTYRFVSALRARQRRCHGGSKQCAMPYIILKWISENCNYISMALKDTKLAIPTSASMPGHEYCFHYNFLVYCCRINVHTYNEVNNRKERSLDKKKALKIQIKIRIMQLWPDMSISPHDPFIAGQCG